MEITIKGVNLEVSDRLRVYAERKIGKLQKFFNAVERAEVEFSDEARGKGGKSKRVEITLRAKGNLIRAEVAESSFYSAVDLAVDKIERQLRKYKTKLISSRRQRTPSSQAGEVENPSAEDTGDSLIKRTKTYTLKPMSPEEAIMQMELADHPFFIFMNAETMEINAVYKRNAGGYGLLVPSKEE